MYNCYKIRVFDREWVPGHRNERCYEDHVFWGHLSEAQQEARRLKETTPGEVWLCIHAIEPNTTLEMLFD